MRSTPAVVGTDVGRFFSLSFFAPLFGTFVAARRRPAALIIAAINYNLSEAFKQLSSYLMRLWTPESSVIWASLRHFLSRKDAKKKKCFKLFVLWGRMIASPCYQLALMRLPRLIQLQLCERKTSYFLWICCHLTAAHQGWYFGTVWFWCK